MSFSDTLGQSLTLPSGSVLKNRFAKSAMSETMGTVGNHVTEELIRLYERWARGGTGLLITGNVMIDPRHIGEPHNVAVEDERDLERLRRWAGGVTREGGQIWMQLNHPGKQIPRMLATGDTLGPSAVPFEPEMAAYFKTPRAMTEAEIEDVIERFARTAAIAKRPGLPGYRSTEHTAIWSVSSCPATTIGARISGAVR